MAYDTELRQTARPCTRHPMVMAGREARSWLRVAANGVKTKRQLQDWLTRGVDYAKTINPK